MENDDNLHEITQNLKLWRLSNEANNVLRPNYPSTSTAGAPPPWFQQSFSPPPQLLSPPSFFSQQRQELQNSDPELPMRPRMRTFNDEPGISRYNNNNNNNNNIIGQPIPYNVSRQTEPTLSSFLSRDYSLTPSSHPYSHTNGYGVPMNSYSSQYDHGNPSQSDFIPLPYENFSANPNGLLKKPTVQNYQWSDFSGDVASSSSNPFPQTPQDYLESLLMEKYCRHYNYSKTSLDTLVRYGHQSPPALSSVEETLGRVADVARDRSNSRALGDMLSVSSPEVVEMVAEEIVGDLRSLSVHEHGFYVVQSLIEVVCERRLQGFMAIFIADSQFPVSICTDDYGNKVMMKLVERLKDDRRKQNMLIRCVCNDTKILSMNSNCKNFLDTCFSTFSYDVLEPLLLTVASNFSKLAKDKNGCCVLQSCIVLSYNNRQNIGERAFNRLISNVVAESKTLSDHPFGNYVMQCVIELKEHNINDIISDKLLGELSTLSIDKGSSNVVEKLILFTENNMTERIIVEIMKSPQFLQICGNNFGNYVIQTALKHSKEKGLSVYRKLYDTINRNVEKLRRNEFGGNVVRTARAEKRKSSQLKFLRFNGD